MNSTNYVILAYAIGLGLIFSYAVSLLVQFRTLFRRRRSAYNSRP